MTKDERRELSLEKRRNLQKLTKSIKQLMEQGVIVAENVNDAIVQYYKRKHHFKEMNTFKGWKEKGFSVVKGEKGHSVWSKPYKSKDEDEKLRFRMATLFGDSQVEKINK